MFLLDEPIVIGLIDAVTFKVTVELYPLALSNWLIVTEGGCQAIILTVTVLEVADWKPLLSTA